MINLVEITEVQFNALKESAKYRGTLLVDNGTWRHFYNKQEGVENCWSRVDNDTKETTYYKQELFK